MTTIINNKESADEIQRNKNFIMPYIAGLLALVLVSKIILPGAIFDKTKKAKLQSTTVMDSVINENDTIKIYEEIYNHWTIVITERPKSKNRFYAIIPNTGERVSIEQGWLEKIRIKNISGETEYIDIKENGITSILDPLIPGLYKNHILIRGCPEE